MRRTEEDAEDAGDRGEGVGTNARNRVRQQLDPVAGWICVRRWTLAGSIRGFSQWEGGKYRMGRNVTALSHYFIKVTETWEHLAQERSRGQPV